MSLNICHNKLTIFIKWVHPVPWSWAPACRTLCPFSESWSANRAATVLRLPAVAGRSRACRQTASPWCSGWTRWPPCPPGSCLPWRCPSGMIKLRTCRTGWCWRLADQLDSMVIPGKLHELWIIIIRINRRLFFGLLSIYSWILSDTYV